MKLGDNPINTVHETGEEQLRQLIEQAGDEARSRKKEALAIHYKKLKAAIAEGIACRQNIELSEIVQ